MRSPHRPQVILPAAGYGQSVGSPEAKELLPLRSGKALINQALEMSLERNWPVTLITRPEKVSLLNHVESFVDKALSLKVCITAATKEWPESILKSKAYWDEWNLVVLPDTEYWPTDIWDEMWKAADHSTDLIVAQHEVEDSADWGLLEATSSGIKVGEKQAGANRAWGLFLFRREWGEKILNAQLESQQESKWIDLEGCRMKALQLESFKDLTRGE